MFETTKWYFPVSWTNNTWRSFNQYITTETFVDPLNKKYRLVKLNELGNKMARCALSMFEKNFVGKSYMVMMACNVFSMREFDTFSKDNYKEAFLKIFPLARVVESDDVLSITILDPYLQFSKYGAVNNMFSGTPSVTPEEEDIWREFAKFSQILCDNQIVEVKVRVSSCLPELPSTKGPDDKADQNG